MRLRRTNNETADENIFWVTMSDLMLGFALVFLVMFFYVFVTNNIKEVEENIAKESANKAMQTALNESNVDAIVDINNGLVKISDLELFELNSAKLSNKGKEYLNKFAPAYFNSLFDNEYLDKNIKKIIIQGHTDSQTFIGSYSEDSQYMKNMRLSLERAYTVADFMINTPYNKVNGERLRKMIIVEGASSSEPVLTDGKEDYAKSRRVELKIVMNN
ncbi:OmpA family protein [bacterium]|nr:OmpA family protein [bacterium]